MSGINYLNVCGLLLDLIGAYFLLGALMVSNKQAIELGVVRLAGTTDEENLANPAVKDRIRQSRNARLAAGLLAGGYFLQILGSFRN